MTETDHSLDADALAPRPSFATRLRSIPDRWPLRAQLVVLLLVLVAAALFASSVAGTAALRGYLLDRVDDQLEDTAHGALAFGRLPGGLDGDSSPGDRGYDGPALTQGFFSEVVDSSGTGNGILRVPIGSDQTKPRLPRLDAATVKRLDGKAFTVDPVGDGDSWRIIVTALPGNSGALVVGTGLTDVENTMHRMEIIQISIGGIVLVIFGMTGYGLVRYSLRKLEHVENTAAAIAAGDLSQRVDVGSERTEIGRLGVALNTMLGTIEQSFAAQQASEAEARASETRMRRFVGDASHELRTPLTSIRGFAELQRQAVDLDVAERNRLTGRIEAEAKRMGLLVEDLLLLARLDQQRPLEREPVDIVAIVRDAAADQPVLAPNHTLSVDISGVVHSATVLGDAARLRQVVSNLLSNAYVHTPAGTHVDIAVATTQEQVTLNVADNGPGLSAEDADRVFERFFRSDPSRTRASGGSGLGLSIVSALVNAHGGSVALQSSPGGGACFTVTLPRVAYEENTVTAD